MVCWAAVGYRTGHNARHGLQTFTCNIVNGESNRHSQYHHQHGKQIHTYASFTERAEEARTHLQAY
jgi:hypothetical protein